jgi:hypothetical protein
MSEVVTIFFDMKYEVAKQVWDNCSSAMVCRAFIHAFRIMRKIVEDEGNNSWLATGACLRNDFFDTNDGIKPHVQLPVNTECVSQSW